MTRRPIDDRSNGWFSIPGERDPVDRPVREIDPELLGHPTPPVSDNGVLEAFLNRPDEGPEPMTAAERAEGKKFGEAFSAYMARERRWYLARMKALTN